MVHLRLMLDRSSLGVHHSKSRRDEGGYCPWVQIWGSGWARAVGGGFWEAVRHRYCPKPPRLSRNESFFDDSPM